MEVGFRELADATRDAVIAVDATGTIAYANTSGSEMLARPRHALVGSDVLELLVQSDVAIYDAHANLRRRGRTDRFQLALHAVDGATQLVDVSARPIFDVHGHHQGSVLTLTPASQQEHATSLEAVDESTEELVARHAPAALFACTADRVWTWTSPQLRTLLRVAPGADLPSWSDLVTAHPANRPGLETFRRAGDSGEVTPPYELQLRRPDGTTLWVEVREKPILEAGRPVEIVGVLTDVETRRQLEDQLGHELELADALGTVRSRQDVARCVVDASTKILDVDAAGFYLPEAGTGDLVLARQVGFGEDFVRAMRRIPAGSPRANLIRSSTSRGFEALDPAALADGLQTTLLYPIRPDGPLLGTLVVASRSVGVFSAPALEAQKVVAGQTGPSLARFAVEASLKRSSSTLRSLASAAPAGIGLVRDRIFEWINDYMVHRTGYPKRDLIGRGTRLLYADEEEYDRVGRLLRQQIERSGTGTVETQWQRRDGEMIDVHVGAAALDGTDLASGMVFTAWDVTKRNAAERERRNLVRQVQQAQKLESLGLLAGGVAHDFNNLLHAILGHANMVGQCLAGNGDAGPHVDAIERAASRAGDLCRQMLAYSGRGSFVIERLHLGEVVRDLVSMLEVSIAKNTELCVDLTDDRLPIEADVSQMRQVVLNLVTNAAEAIGDEAGLVRVTVAPAHYGQERLKSEFWQSGLKPGTYVTLRVEDDGCGMDAATRERIFEPFFTTKFTGRGLGLAAIQGIVRGHGGAIRVASQPGRGTTVTVVLPVASGRIKTSSIPTPAPRPSQGTGVVLLADDEVPVRELQRMMLETAGFDVVAVEDGQQAVEVFRERPEAFRCVLLDLTMPVMDGEAAFRALRAIRADVPVILCSGFSAQELDHRFEDGRPSGFLEKPFKADVLLGLIEEVAPV